MRAFERPSPARAALRVPRSADTGRPERQGIAWYIEEPLLARLAALYEIHIRPLDELLDGISDAPDRKDLLAVDPLRSPTPRLCHARALIVSALARQLARNEGREVFGPRDWRVLHYVVLGGGTLRYAVSRLSECFEALNGRLGRVSLTIDGARAVIHMDSLRAEPSLPGCAIDLYGIARMHGLFGTLIDRSIPMTDLALDYSEILFTKLELPEMPAAFHLAEGWTGFAFPSAYLDFPLLCTEERLAEWTRHSFMGTLAPPRSDANWPARVRSMILASLRDRRRLPSLAEIADHFLISPATVRRRLAGEGASFREMRDSCRREVALRLLQRRDISIEAIAEQLDFCDSDAFRAAFRGWVGMSPTDFRRTA